MRRFFTLCLAAIASITMLSAQQIVADGYLAGCLETGINKQHVKQCGVEHYVTMIAYEGISMGDINIAHINAAPLTCL